MRQKPRRTFLPVVHDKGSRRECSTFNYREEFRRRRSICVSWVKNGLQRFPLDERERFLQGCRRLCSIGSSKWSKTQLNQTLSRHLFWYFSQLDVFIVPRNAASPAVTPLTVVGLHL